MNNPGKQVAAMPEFAPLLEVITTPIEADVIAYFQGNPDEDLDAALMAGKLHRDDIESVQKTLENLRSSGVLSSEIKGVAQSCHYRFTPAPPLQQAFDRIFREPKTRDSWADFRGYLEEEDRRRQGKRKILILAAAGLIGLGLAVGIYFLVQNIQSSGREPVQVDLSRFTGVHETWYSNGQIKSRIEYANGRREGSFSAWFENGQKMAEGSYRDNLPDGRWGYWNEKGNPQMMIAFQDGRAVDSQLSAP